MGAKRYAPTVFPACTVPAQVAKLPGFEDNSFDGDAAAFMHFWTGKTARSPGRLLYLAAAEPDRADREGPDVPRYCIGVVFVDNDDGPAFLASGASLAALAAPLDEYGFFYGTVKQQLWTGEDDAALLAAIENLKGTI